MKRHAARSDVLARRNDSSPATRSDVLADSSPGRRDAVVAEVATQVEIFMCLPSDTVARAALMSDVAFVLPITSTVGQPRAPQTATLSRPVATPGPAAAVPGAVASASAMPPLGQAAMAPGPMTIDPANGPFLGGVPTGTGDVLPTAVFLILFALGAFTHISIYRANSKRGHKFLLSDLMFDFCMVRCVTCILRIIWAFFGPRGIILAALLFENGGSVVVFAVNLFFAQRIVRAMHPRIGWHPAFGYFSLFLVFSVPTIIVMNVALLSVSFFSVGNVARLDALEEALKFGSAWNLMLSVMPLVMIFIACALPGPPAENFGSGELRCKASVLVFSAVTLSSGAAVRLASLTNPAAALAMSPLFDRSVFYVTGFMLEIMTVIAYAYFRVDLLFHVPNGSRGPGDYTGAKMIGDRSWSSREIEGEFARLGIRYQRLQAPSGSQSGEFIAVFYPSEAANMSGGLRGAAPRYGNADLPRRSARVSRSRTLIDSVKPSWPRGPTRTLHKSEKTLTSQFDS